MEKALVIVVFGFFFAGNSWAAPKHLFEYELLYYRCLDRAPCAQMKKSEVLELDASSPRWSQTHSIDGKDIELSADLKESSRRPGSYELRVKMILNGTLRTEVSLAAEKPEQFNEMILPTDALRTDEGTFWAELRWFPRPH